MALLCNNARAHVQRAITVTTTRRVSGAARATSPEAMNQDCQLGALQEPIEADTKWMTEVLRIHRSREADCN